LSSWLALHHLAVPLDPVDLLTESCENQNELFSIVLSVMTEKLFLGVLASWSFGARAIA
jgi:hypothetical protein